MEQKKKQLKIASSIVLLFVVVSLIGIIGDVVTMDLSKAPLKCKKHSRGCFVLCHNFL